MSYWSISSYDLVNLLTTLSPERAGLLVLIGGLSALLLYVQYLKDRSLYGGSETQQPQTNCAACGARISADAETCGYCGAATADEERSRGW